MYRTSFVLAKGRHESGRMCSMKKVVPLVVGLVLGLILGSLGVTGASASAPSTAHPASAPASVSGNVMLSIIPSTASNTRGDYTVLAYRYAGRSWIPCGSACQRVVMNHQGNTYVISLPKGWSILGSSYMYEQDTKTGTIQAYACGLTSNVVATSVPSPIDTAVFASLPLVSATIIVHRPGNPAPSGDTTGCGGMK